MRLARFNDLLATYGAHLERWPDPDAARRLLARSPEARRALADAARIDAALDGTPGGAAARPDAAALARMRARVQRRVARLPVPEAPPSWWARHVLLGLSLRFGALAAMAAVGIWMGWAQPMPTRADAAITDPLAPIQIYAVPDDGP